jgi:hypothetical protein
LRGFRKIPFTCSYLPGKSKAHLVFWFGIIPAIFTIHKVVDLEMRAMASPWAYGGMLLGIGAIAAAVGRMGEPEPEIQFEETPADELVGLGLDGL